MIFHCFDALELCGIRFIIKHLCYNYINNTKNRRFVHKKRNIYGIVKKCAVREYPKSWIGDIRQRDERAALKSLVPQVGDRLH